MYTILENYTFLVTLMTSCVFWYLSLRLAKKEDERYELSKKEKIVSFAITIGGAIAINFRNPDVVFMTLFLMTGVISILSISLVIDFKLQELPDCLTILSLILSLVFLFVANFRNPGLTVLVTIITAIVMGIISVVFAGIGFGDVKLIVPVLFFVPPIYIMNYALNTILIALLTAIILYIKTRDRKMKFAFGPFIILGLLSIFIHIILI